MMQLRYKKPDGTRGEISLSERPVTIGRSPEADVVLPDEKASRIHCGIRSIDGEYQIKDLQSKNGTFVNESAIDTKTLNSGDRIRIGSTIFVCESEGLIPGANTVLHQVEEEMSHGKGYSTLLKEIVDTVEDPQSE